MKNPRWLLVIGFVPGLAFKGLNQTNFETENPLELPHP